MSDKGTASGPGPLEDTGLGAHRYLLVSGSCDISTEVEVACGVQEHNWEDLVEVGQDWLPGREKTVRANRANQGYLQVLAQPCPSLTHHGGI